jgi:hypothetical protein
MSSHCFPARTTGTLFGRHCITVLDYNVVELRQTIKWILIPTPLFSLAEGSGRAPPPHRTNPLVFSHSMEGSWLERSIASACLRTTWYCLSCEDEFAGPLETSWRTRASQTNVIIPSGSVAWLTGSSRCRHPATGHKQP